MKDLLYLLDHVRVGAAVNMQLDLSKLDYHDAFRTEPLVTEQDFISLGKLIRKVSTVKIISRLVTGKLKRILSLSISQHLLSEYGLDILRTTAIKGFYNWSV